MPRGIPKNKVGISKMEGVRRALAHLGNEASNKDIRELLKSRFAIDMDTSRISNYKSSLKAAAKIAAIRKPDKPAVEATATSGITLDDIRAVKEVIDKVGAEKVRQLAEVLGK